MLPTPSTSHVSYDTIYEPAEDSFLFLDTLSSVAEKAWLHARFAPGRCSTAAGQSGSRSGRAWERTPRSVPVPVPLLLTELGPGSGVIVAFLTAHARLIFGADVLSLAIDVNPHACSATRTTVEKALLEPSPEQSLPQRSLYLSSIQGDLAAPLRPGEVDVLVFNPPYVPTEAVPSHWPSNTPSQRPAGHRPTFEEASHLLALSYAGGTDGMEVTNRLLEQIPRLLSSRGVAYVLLCRGNKPDEVKARVRAWSEAAEEEEEEEGLGALQSTWRAETVGTSGKTAGWEKLEIVRIWREWEPRLCDSRP